MKYSLIVLLVTLGCGVPEDEVASCSMPKSDVAIAKTSDGISVHLKASNSSYLVGEPVVITVSLKNHTSKDIDAWLTSLKNQVQIFVSDGKQFKRFESGFGDTGKVPKYTELVAPGETKTYQFKVLYSFWKPGSKENKLTFPALGTYCIKVKYPLFPKREMVESNVAHITVKKPTGDDAKVWQKINQPNVLRFLQSGQLDPDAEDIPVELTDLLEKFPKSAYAGAFKDSLRSYYQEQASQMYVDELKADPWMQRLRGLLEIKLEEDPGLFPEDKRLNAKIQYHYREPTSIADVYSDISKQSGVTLDVDPALKNRTLKSLAVTPTLREFMVNQSAYKSKWIKDGDGYKLVPEPEKAE